MLTPHFLLSEFTRSDTAQKMGIDNTPPEEAVENIKRLCSNVLEPVRKIVGNPLIITSGYRSVALNRALRGVVTSQHLLGQAADIAVPGMAPRALFNLINKGSVPYDQLILYPTFVHVSYRCGNNRRQALVQSRVRRL